MLRVDYDQQTMIYAYIYIIVLIREGPCKGVIRLLENSKIQKNMEISIVKIYIRFGSEYRHELPTTKAITIFVLTKNWKVYAYRYPWFFENNLESMRRILSIFYRCITFFVFQKLCLTHRVNIIPYLEPVGKFNKRRIKAARHMHVRTYTIHTLPRRYFITRVDLSSRQPRVCVCVWASCVYSFSKINIEAYLHTRTHIHTHTHTHRYTRKHCNERRHPWCGPSTTYNNNI